MLVDCSAVLAPSRTLRAGFAGAAGGILDSACVRRSGQSKVGTKGWSLPSNKGIDKKPHTRWPKAG
jgi:hypothetical protein